MNIFKSISFHFYKCCIVGTSLAIAGAAFAADIPTVQVVKVVDKPIEQPQVHVGRIEAIQTVDLQARVEGWLGNLSFNEGSMVDKGEELYTIERHAYKAQVRVDEARLLEAEASLTRAQQYLDRLQTVQSGGVSQTDIETAQTNKQEAEARVQESQAQLEKSLLNLSYTSIKAPISGKIGVTQITPGNLVGPSSGVLSRIVQTHPIRVVFSVNDKDLHTYREMAINGLEPTLRMGTGQLYPSAGRLTFLDNQVDISTGTVAVRAEFDNLDGQLLPGQYVNVVLTPTSPQSLPVIPQASVMENKDGKFVYVVDADNTVTERPIATLGSMGTKWIVSQGLESGETVLTSGLQKTRPGMTVSPVQADQS